MNYKKKGRIVILVSSLNGDGDGVGLFSLSPEFEPWQTG